MSARKKRSQQEKTPAAGPAGEELSFEQAIEQLQRIVEQMEDEQLGLDEAIANYEQGVTLLRHCMALLRKAEQRIVLLTGTDEEGNPLVEPLSESDSASEDLVPGRRRPLRPKDPPEGNL